jgi:hypothetical protein
MGMKAGKLRKLLKQVPKDADVKVLTYGYSEGIRQRYDLDDNIIKDAENYQVVLTVDE